MKKFCRNLFAFIFFMPIYILYYLKLALKFNRLTDWLSFLRGTIEGLLGISLVEKNIPFSYISLIRGAIGNNVKNIIDLGCGDGRLIEALSQGEKWEVVGVDIDLTSINRAGTISWYKKLITGDLEKILKRFIKQRKKFDVGLCSQVMEHLPREKGKRVLDLLDKIVYKRIVISTPNGFMEQIEESLNTSNPYQHHISCWYENEFIARGYIVRGLGLKPVWSYDGFGRSKSRFVRVTSRIISYLLFPLSYYFPFLGSSLLAIKKL